LPFALDQLWQQRVGRQLTHTAYDRMGGLQAALATYADSVLAGFSEVEQAQIRQIFVQLVHLGQGSEDTRQVATQAQVADWSLVARLADQRLVVTGLDEGAKQETVDVVHEALIRAWRPLQDWMESEQEFRVWQEGLRRDMKDGVLLRDAHLAVEQEWLAKQMLPTEEKAFIKASLAERDRRLAEKRRQQQRWAVFVMVFFVVAVGFRCRHIPLLTI